ncbi:MAG: hypothetical protein EOO55_02960 [Hymenobacter sp.]|nr:MAG: hypothetical protein EOO55_02960 [Hymenobacter sp.]
MKCISISKEKLFDGQQEGFYTFKHQFQVPSDLVIYERDFRKNYFDDLERIMNHEDFEQLMREGHFTKPKGAFGNYLGSDNLSLNYFISNGLLFVFANGEFQPSRYKIYMEGIWQMS